MVKKLFGCYKLAFLRISCILWFHSFLYFITPKFCALRWTSTAWWASFLLIWEKRKGISSIRVLLAEIHILCHYTFIRFCKTFSTFLWGLVIWSLDKALIVNVSTIGIHLCHSLLAFCPTNASFQTKKSELIVWVWCDEEIFHMWGAVRCIKFYDLKLAKWNM